jgi:hypothetical protein
MTSNLSLISDNTTIASLIDLAVKRNYLDFLNIIYNYKYKLLFEEYIKNFSQEKVSIINTCLFIVKDLDSFIKGIRNKGYNINGGPQNSRSKLSGLESNLANIDTDFREALCNHNNYHVIQGNINEGFYLSREKFSYVNIHMNIGNVK